MNLIQPYYKKTVTYKFENHEFNFMVSQDIFSSFNVDHGTQRLLRTFLFEKIDTFKKVLDLGCGYGSIGIVLKALCPNAEVQMVDRDALAVKYAQANVKLNGITDNVFTYGSLGYDNVRDTDFDLIVSNIPAKVGEHVLTHMLKDARFHLVKNGLVIVVVIDAINDYVYKELTTDETIKILYHKSWPGHHVYHYTFTDEAYKQERQSISAFERGEYKRQKNTFVFRGKSLTLDTTYHLPEFDQLSYDSELLLSQLVTVTDKLNTILVFNPGQGYIPLAVMKQYNPQKLCLVDRDLQALTISKLNLLENGYLKDKINIYHQVGIAVDSTNIDTIVGVLPKKQELAVYELLTDQVFIHLKPSGYCIFSSSSTVITRIERAFVKRSRFEIIERAKNKGRSVLVLRKKAFQ